VRRREATTALMAAAGMGGGTAWVRPPREEREALALDSVKVALELGVDLNAANVDGRTALDAAESMGYDAVVDLLLEKGAKPGAPVKAAASPVKATTSPDR